MIYIFKPLRRDAHLLPDASRVQGETLAYGTRLRIVAGSRVGDTVTVKDLQGSLRVRVAINSLEGV